VVPLAQAGLSQWAAISCVSRPRGSAVMMYRRRLLVANGRRAKLCTRASGAGRQRAGDPSKHLLIALPNRRRPNKLKRAALACRRCQWGEMGWLASDCDVRRAFLETKPSQLARSEECDGAGDFSHVPRQGVVQLVVLHPPATDWLGPFNGKAAV
jgi:hypothetical protein